MDIRSSLDGLKSLLGPSQAAQTTQVAANARNQAAINESGALDSDSATVSSAAAQVSQTASDEAVRMDKVAAVRSALASGTYNVPASAVASKITDSMMVSA
jgi:negative regulator of flagellin synthesis FlgM